jgi:hypothetical protein
MRHDAPQVARLLGVELGLLVERLVLLEPAASPGRAGHQRL